LEEKRRKAADEKRSNILIRQQEELSHRELEKSLKKERRKNRKDGFARDESNNLNPAMNQLSLYVKAFPQVIK